MPTRFFLENPKPHQTTRSDGGDQEYDQDNDEGNWGSESQSPWSVNRMKLKEKKYISSESKENRLEIILLQ